jgi:hypothetical protein
MTKKIVSVLLAATAFAAAPAAAQTATQSTSGTVNVTGFVAARCSVVQPGGSNVQTFAGTIDLQRLDAADGTLRGDLSTSGTAAPADGLKVNTRVVCTSANPTVGISATKLNTGGASDPGAGYSNDIDYTAQVKVKTAGGSVEKVEYATKAGGTAVTRALGQRLAGGADNNVEVSIYGLASEAGATSLLAQGTYTSTVTVSIEPTL